MLSIKLFFADVFAKVGSFFCLKAMWLAGSGHFDFEISNCTNPFLRYSNFGNTQYPNYKREKTVKIILYVLFLLCMIWTALIIAYAIESSCDKVVVELQKEHKDDVLYRKNYR